MFRILTAAAVLITTASTSHAAQLFARGPIFGGSSQSSAVCYIYNSGGTAVTLSAAAILDQNGVNVTSTSSNCTMLAGGKSCTVAANKISTGLAHLCTVTASSATALRGYLDIRDAANPASILTTQALR